MYRHPPDNGPDRLVRHPVLDGQVAQAFVPGALGNRGPESSVKLRLLLRRAHQDSGDGHREVGVGEFVLAYSTPVTSASATWSPRT